MPIAALKCIVIVVKAVRREIGAAKRIRKKCGQIVTDKHCAHYETDRVEISGTIIRKYIGESYIPDETMMRREIFQAILDCGQVFIA